MKRLIDNCQDIVDPKNCHNIVDSQGSMSFLLSCYDRFKRFALIGIYILKPAFYPRRVSYLTL